MKDHSLQTGSSAQTNRLQQSRHANTISTSSSPLPPTPTSTNKKWNMIILFNDRKNKMTTVRDSYNVTCFPDSDTTNTTNLSTPSALNDILCHNIHVSPNITCSQVDDFFILPLRGQPPVLLARDLLHHMHQRCFLQWLQHKPQSHL